MKPHQRTGAGGMTRRGMLLHSVAATAGAALGMPALRSHAQSADLPDAVAALIPAAQAESGAVAFGLSIPADRAGPFQHALDEFYGVTLDLEFQGGLGPQKAAEVAQLVSRGIPAGIDCYYAGEGTSIFLRDSDTVVTDGWAAELGIPEDRLVDASSVKIIDSSLPLMSYNTETVDEAELPTSWADLLDPKWKGRITTPRIPGGAFLYNTYSVGEEEMTRILEGVMEQDVIWVPRTPDAATRLLSGEASLAIGVDIESQVIRGAPLAYVRIDPMFLAPWGAHVVKNCPNPNIAKLFAYFVSTNEGQQALSEATGYSIVDLPGSTKEQTVGHMNPGYVPQDWIGENYDRLVAKYSDIMGIR